MYHAEGGLPTRAELLRYVGTPSDSTLRIVAGECGVPKPCDDPSTALCNYVVNADKQGYDAAFLWKLEGDLVDPKAAGRPRTGAARALAHTLKTRPTDGFSF